MRRITTEIMIRAWPHIKDHILEVMNLALDSGRFPRLWKVGLVKVLYKGVDKDSTSQILSAVDPAPGSG